MCTLLLIVVSVPVVILGVPIAERVQLPMSMTESANRYAYTVRHAHTTSETRAMIELTERMGCYEERPLVVVKCRQPMLNITDRVMERCVLHNRTLSSWLFQQVRSIVPTTMNGMTVVGMNPTLRFWKLRGGYVDYPHIDDAEVNRETGWKSQITYHLYLNADGIDGGGHVFVDPSVCHENGTRTAQYANVVLPPESGMALLFEHQLVHRGDCPHTGTVYLIRADIVYSLTDTTTIDVSPMCSPAPQFA